MPNEPTRVEQTSDCELVVTRTFAATADIVFEAWTRAEIFRQWWVPKSFGIELLACEMDVRVGGGYRLEYPHPSGEGSMAFFGEYREVIPNERIVWTNAESDDGGVTTVTFVEADGRTTVTLRERFASKEALEAGSAGAEFTQETLEQLSEFLVTRVDK